MRADEDKDGMLSLSEFMVWFSTEISAALPFKRNGAYTSEAAAAPLYNRFVYYMLGMSCERWAGASKEMMSSPLVQATRATE